jgi:hypothetical protein
MPNLSIIVTNSKNGFLKLKSKTRNKKTKKRGEEKKTKRYTEYDGVGIRYFGQLLLLLITNRYHHY